jgi:hypothetical protein
MFSCLTATVSFFQFKGKQIELSIKLVFGVLTRIELAFSGRICII